MIRYELVYNNRFGYTITEQPVYNDGQFIYGQLYRPKREGQVPLVIFSHELTSTHETGIEYAKELASLGVAVYIFDYRGGSVRSRSDGATTDMSVMTEVADLEAVLQTAQSWDFVDAGRIILLGASQGGVVASIVASRHVDALHAMILMYPALLINDDIHRMFKSLDKVPDRMRYLGWIPVGKRYVADMWDFDVYRDMGRFDKPVLLLHGDKDGAVPLSYSERAAEVYPKGRLHVIKGRRHLFPTRSSLNEALGQIIEFLAEQGIVPKQ